MTAPIMFLQLKFNFGNQGWTETHWLQAAGFSTAVTDGKAILAARLAILPDSVSVVHGSVIQRGVVGVKRKAKVLGSFPQAGAASTAVLGATSGKPDTCETAVMARLSSSLGDWANRYIHGLPDEVVTQRALVNAVVIPGPSDLANAPVAPAVKLTWEAALGNYLQLVWQKTQMAQKSASTPGTYDPVAIETVTIEKVTNKKIGLPFGASRGRATRV